MQREEDDISDLQTCNGHDVTEGFMELSHYFRAVTPPGNLTETLRHAERQLRASVAPPKEVIPDYHLWRFVPKSRQTIISVHGVKPTFGRSRLIKEQDVIHDKF
nr:hypothetical protein [Tanacetum cinerariifolium]